MPYHILSIRIGGNAKKNKVKSILFDLAHFRNILVLLINRYYNIYNESLLNESILYGFLSKNYNGKYKDQFEKAFSNIENNSELKSLLEQLKLQKQKIDNASFVQYVIRQIIKDFKVYFKTLKLYQQNQKRFNGMPKPPKAKKLKNLVKFTISAKSETFKIENSNLIIRLRKGQYLKAKLPKNFKHEISSIRLKFVADEIYVDVVYSNEAQNKIAQGNYKAGIDLGLDELIAVVSDNPNLKSFIVSGKELKAYNQWYNKEKAKLQTQIDNIKNKLKDGTNDDAKKLEKQLKELVQKVKILSAKRKRWFDDNFHKISRKIVDLLYATGHSVIYIGKNLLESKNGIDLGKKFNQQFVFIPYRRLLEMIKYKAQKLGMQVIEVDESYTSKTSPFADIHTIQKTHDKSLCNGKREGNLFKDYVKNKLFHADLVGAVNIMRVGASLRDLSFYENIKLLFIKLCNPIKCKLVDFIYKVSPKSLQLLTAKIRSSKQEINSCSADGSKFNSLL